jgi:hypothetical protein
MVSSAHTPTLSLMPTEMTIVSLHSAKLGRLERRIASDLWKHVERPAGTFLRAGAVSGAHLAGLSSMICLAGMCLKWPPRNLFPFKQKLPLLSIQPH